MLIDRSHKKWFAASIVILAGATVVFITYAVGTPQGVSGRRGFGLACGITGFTFMLVAALLGARKKVPVWRLGRMQTWMRAHLWLGFLSFPLILFHADFHTGGKLTTVLVWLFAFVYASGILGAALQHFLPHFYTTQVPMETIFEQIGHVREQLLTEAQKLIEDAATSLEGDFAKASDQQRASAASAGTMGDFSVGTGLQTDEQAAFELRKFFRDELKPFLESPRSRRVNLREAARARAAFRQLRILVPASLESTLEDLENIYEETRQLEMQSRLHKALHLWLFVHVPLSYTLLVLAAVHAVVALRY
ncbi:MAG: hypothetical protein ACRD23_05810 [Terriglobales bacterium]